MKRILLLLTLIALVGCEVATPANSTALSEQAQTEKNQRNLLKAQPPVRLTSSLERENINKRTKLWNDPSKVSYIYLLSYGRIFAFYPIKGKVSSVNSQISNPAQIICNETYEAGNYSVIPSPAEDGSYGTNGDAIFFFATDGAYFEWNGEYHLCDKPLKLSQPPLVTLESK